MIPTLRRAFSYPAGSPSSPPSPSITSDEFKPKPKRPVHLRVTSHIETETTTLTVNGRQITQSFDKMIVVIEPGETRMPISPPRSRVGSGPSTPGVGFGSDGSSLMSLISPSSSGSGSGSGSGSDGTSLSDEGFGFGGIRSDGSSHRDYGHIVSRLEKVQEKMADAGQMREQAGMEDGKVNGTVVMAAGLWMAFSLVFWIHRIWYVSFGALARLLALGGG